MPPVTTFGFVGLGNFAQDLAQTCQRVGSIRIGSCYDPDRERRQGFAQTFGARAVDTLEAIALDPTIDGVVIASPNHLHAAHAEALARAGKHCFVEKPLATELDQVDRIIAACHDAGRLLAVGHQLRRAAVYRRIARMIDDGELGRVYAFEANHCGDLLRAWPADDWRFGERGVGPLLHKGIHKIDVLNRCFGAAETVATTAIPLAINPTMDETTISTIRYPGGIVGSLTAGFRYNNASFNVYGELRSVRYSGFGRRMVVKQERNWRETEVDCGEADPLAEELGEFAAAIRGEATIEVDGHAAREAVLLAVAAERAARSGREVAIDDLRAETTLGTVA